MINRSNLWRGQPSWLAVFWVVKFYYVILEPFPLYCRGYHFEYQAKKYYSNSSLYLGYLFSTVGLVRSMGV